MNIQSSPKIAASVCPHDCPSACALEVELLDDNRIGRLHGAKSNDYTKGVICEKVARYAERLYHPDRLLYPLKRSGPKGSGQFTRISWDEALDETAQAFLAAEKNDGAESVWPFYDAGTMGLLMRDGIERLTNGKAYSRAYSSYCIAIAWPGYYAGTGRISGVDPREMDKSDLIVIWGGNPVNTQVNVMTHALNARKQRGAKIACIDIYETGTMKQADIKLLIRPGTDGALACAIMHVLFRDGHADRAYLANHTKDAEALEQHLKDKTPAWAAKICDLPASEIEAFAKLIGQTPKSFFRLGYGFSRSRNGAVNVHAVTSIPTVTGAWAHEGGGALLSSSGIYTTNKTMIEGRDLKNAEARMLDQSRLGEVLLNNPADLRGGPPVKAMLIQNTNPASVAPDQTRVKQGLAREDLFLCVHEQFMTETAKFADIILPATMFLEHDDIYHGTGHSYVQLGPKLREAPGECRNNHEVICALAERLGLAHESFTMTPDEVLDWTIQNSGYGTLADLKEKKWSDRKLDFTTAHFLNGFGHADGKFHFKPDWAKAATATSPIGPWVPLDDMPALPDYWPVIEEANAAYPFRLATSPARTFLNSSFNETPTSRQREGRPTVLVHPDDLAKLNLTDGDKVTLGSARGQVTLHAKAFNGLRHGVLIAESIWPDEAYEDGHGINSLTGSDQPAPAAGGAYHDNRVWLKKA